MPQPVKKKLKSLAQGNLGVSQGGGKGRVPMPNLSATLPKGPVPPKVSANFTVQPGGPTNKPIGGGVPGPGKPQSGSVGKKPDSSLIAKLAASRGGKGIGDYNATHKHGKPIEALAKLRASRSGKVETGSATQAPAPNAHGPAPVPKPGVAFGASAGPRGTKPVGTRPGAIYKRKPRTRRNAFGGPSGPR